MIEPDMATTLAISESLKAVIKKYDLPREETLILYATKFKETLDKCALTDDPADVTDKSYFNIS